MIKAGYFLNQAGGRIVQFVVQVPVLEFSFRGTGMQIDDTELQEKTGTEEFDIVVANILADVIIPMAPVIPARLKKGGYFITSGIIDFKENDVKEAIEKAGLEVVEINHQGEWVNITARKN